VMRGLFREPTASNGTVAGLLNGEIPERARASVLETEGEVGEREKDRQAKQFLSVDHKQAHA